MNRSFPALIVTLVALGAGAAAHHRYVDTYVEGREQTVEGDVTQLIYRNPHSFLVITTQRSQYAPERWVVELPGAHRLSLHGIVADTIKVGQRLIVQGAPGR